MKTKEVANTILVEISCRALKEIAISFHRQKGGADGLDLSAVSGAGHKADIIFPGD